MSGSGYTKLFASITDSTIWQAPDATRLVWITMLALADQNGYVGASVPGLASRARVSMPDCLAALETFRQPDEWSRTPDYEGRRIVDADGGWFLLNHSKYRAIQDAEARREQARLAMAKLRANRKESVTVSDVNSGDGRLAQEEAEEDTDTKKKSKACAASANRGHRLPADWAPSDADVTFAVERRVNWREELEAFRDYWDSKPGREACKTDWSKTWKNWIRKARSDVKPQQPQAKSATRQAIENIGRTVNAMVNPGSGNGPLQAPLLEAPRMPSIGHGGRDRRGVD